MKKRTTGRIITLIVAFILILSSVTACGGGPTQGNQASATTTAAQTTAAQTAAAQTTAAQTAAAQTTAAQTTQAAQVTQAQSNEMQTLIYYRRSQGEQKPDNDKVKEYVENQVGIRIEMNTVPSDQYSEKMSVVLSSGQEFDALSVLALSENVQTLKAKGFIIPINEYLDEYGANIKKVIGDKPFEILKDKDGVIWGFPRREARPRGNQPAIREDWVNALGMDMPTTIVEYEAFMQGVLDTDLNGNGIQDEIPLSALAGMAGILQDFRASFTGANGNFYIDESGTLIPLYAHPNYKVMLGKFQEWYKKGYIHKEFYMDSDAKKSEYKNANRVGSFCNWFTGGDQTFKQVEGCIYSPLPPFQDALVIPAWGSNAEFTAEVFLSSTGKNPQLMVQYIDWVCSDSYNAATTFYGLEGENWIWKDKAANSIELLEGYSDRYSGYMNVLETFYPDFFPKVEYTDPVGIDINRVQAITKDWTYLENTSGIYAFNLIGTPAERITGDGQTMIDEAMLKVIYGEMDLDAWEKVVDDYMKLDGNILSQVWTEQYNEFYAN